jgi:NAD(P)-dependent dehydrogenase (short-subunit alcohol dehydrogenase family)
MPRLTDAGQSGNTGLGKETILQLAKHNPSKIYLACRTESKGQEALKSIRNSLGQSSLDLQYLPLDLASFASVKSAAESLQSSTDRLDILICNAGVMATPPGKTEQGHEIQFGTNHIGHHLLTQRLLPILETTAALSHSDVRVITLSSVANEQAPSIKTMLDMEELCAAGTWARYGASKAGNILFAAELARRYPTLTSVSVHPGIIKSDLWNSVNENNALIRFGMKLAGPFIYQTIETGAHNTLWAAAAVKKDELQNGAYYTPVGKLDHKNAGNKRAKDVEAGKALWEWTEAEILKAGS